MPLVQAFYLIRPKGPVNSTTSSAVHLHGTRTNIRPPRGRRYRRRRRGVVTAQLVASMDHGMARIVFSAFGSG